MRLSCKAKYKLEIRYAYVDYENKLSYELANKNLPDFWKTWNAKFKKNVSKQVNINGCTNGNDIANEFAAHFSNVFVIRLLILWPMMIIYVNGMNVL